MMPLAEQNNHFAFSASERRDASNRLAKTQKGVLKTIILLACLLALCGALIAISYLFCVRSVEVTGNAFYSSDEILEVLDVSVGAPLSSIHTAELSERLVQRFSRIRSASVTKTWTGRVTVTVTEERIAYAIPTSDGGYWMVTAQFLVLDRVEQKPEPYPELWLPLTPETCGEILPVQHGEVAALARIREAFEAGMPSAVSVYDLSVPYSYCVITSDGVTVFVGNTDDITAKVEAARTVWEHQASEQWIEAEIHAEDPARVGFRVTK